MDPSKREERASKGGRFREAFPLSYPIRREQHAEINRYVDRLIEESEDRRGEFFRPDFSSVRCYEESILPLRRRFLEMLGCPPPKAVDPPPPRLERIGQDAVADVYRVWIEVAEGVQVYGIYMVPRDVAGRAPLLVAQHGGGGCPEAICDFDTRVNYRGFGPEAVRRGYIVWAPLVLMQVTYGGDPEPKTDRRYLDRRARLVGTSIVGIEVHKIMAGVRALRDAREEIDGRRIGMTGLSYGGYYTLYAMAGCPEIAAGACSGYFRSLAVKLSESDAGKASDVGFFGLLSSFGLAETVGLICPRPLLIQNGVNDPVVPVEEAREAAPRAKAFYDHLGIGGRFAYHEHPGGHEFDNDAIFAFFEKQLG